MNRPRPTFRLAPHARAVVRLRELGETVRMALTALSRSPLRTGLTVLGLAIGVGAYVAMTSFGQAAKRSVVAQFASFGVNLVRVQSLVRDPGAAAKPPRPILKADLEALRRELTTASRIVPSVRSLRPASAHGIGYSVGVVGTTPDYFIVKQWSAQIGGTFDANDMVERGKVCVLGSTPANVIFGGANPIGETLALGQGLTCHVIGVLESKGLNASGRDLDDLIVVPVTTFEAYIGLAHGYTEIEIEALSPAVLPALRDEATRIMRRTHAIAVEEPEDFRIASPAEAIRAVNNVSSILTRLLAAIAAVSLLVGGIGIMNIQLVSVAERTREIGIRSALGASPNQIMVQFLVEAVVLSSIGAFVGVVAGVSGAWAVGRAMHWAHAVDLPGAITAAVFGVGTGVVFGYAPARHAARLEPIDAIRQE